MPCNVVSCVNSYSNVRHGGKAWSGFSGKAKRSSLSGIWFSRFVRIVIAWYFYALSSIALWYNSPHFKPHSMCSARSMSQYVPQLLLDHNSSRPSLWFGNICVSDNVRLTSTKQSISFRQDVRPISGINQLIFWANLAKSRPSITPVVVI